MRTLALAILLVAGCETGTEIAGVSSATVARAPDGSVIVTATLDCMLAAGMGRGDGNCDADKTKVCVRASWFETEPPPGGALAEAETCETVAKIRGATVQIRFATLPDGAKTVRVLTADQHRTKDETRRRGVIATR